jgi:hypothetical protein
MFQYSGFRENKLSFICTIIIAEVFPEYKYAFIYRGMLNKFMCLNKVVAKEENVVTKSQFEKYLRYLRGTLLNEGNLGINIKLLRDFISFCADKDIKVVILESQYISLAHAEKNIKLNQIVVRELNKLSREYKNVKFIPKSELYQFQNTDYFVNNLTHVTKEAALRYIEQFFRYMERSNF